MLWIVVVECFFFLFGYFDNKSIYGFIRLLFVFVCIFKYFLKLVKFGSIFKYLSFKYKLCFLCMFMILLKYINVDLMV